jgi:hypothetical protein
MCKFYVVQGRVVEVQRFINVPRSIWEEHPARERRELWIATPMGREIKLVVHSRQMPARYGHQVEALLVGGQLVGLHNVTTGGQVNFVKADPPVLLRRAHVAAVMALMLGCFVGLVAGAVLLPLIGGAVAVAAVPILLSTRLVERLIAGANVDWALNKVRRSRIAPPASRPLLHLVK